MQPPIPRPEESEASATRSIDEAHCISLIESTPVGRVGFVSDGLPLVLPVTFVWIDGGVVFRAVEGQKLAAAANGQKVCFEVDHWDEHTHDGWSVVVHGTSHEVTDWAEKEQLETSGLVAWTKDRWRTRWVRVVPDEITGRTL